MDGEAIDFVHFLASFGLRVSEATVLTVSDVSVKGRTLNLRTGKLLLDYLTASVVLNLRCPADDPLDGQLVLVTEPAEDEEGGSQCPVNRLCVGCLRDAREAGAGDLKPEVYGIEGQ